MARQEIILGTPPTGLGGDTPRVASAKINAMTLELYQGIGTPAAPLPLERGGTGATTQAGAQSALGLPKAFRDSVKAGEVLTVGHAGWNGGTAQVMGNGTDCNILITAMLYALNGTYTNGPPNFSGNAFFLKVSVHGAGYYHQEAYGITQSIRAERICVNGAWGAWRIMYNDFNVSLDPSSVSGGINSRTIISGMVINKFVSGLIVMNGPIGTTASIAANTVGTVTLTLPASSGPDSSFATPYVSLIPNGANDFALMTAYMLSTTQVNLVIRNGATAQTFYARAIIIGHWK
ncbi:pyocin knob domain-containing protein [Pseudomonas sp. S5F11]|uniref:pyocin knob domain-containing protein n=1 Tax=Pseudomonas sp. S5F11 TaxID=2866385 RepID=UPI001C7DD168|nr:pyocin knob domain-containing protein [Pseudomonas sp. S5F11]MBX4136268.1 pyocin knob domain-containing protein [Pseudomonas sp. S5F11]